MHKASYFDPVLSHVSAIDFPNCIRSRLLLSFDLRFIPLKPESIDPVSGLIDIVVAKAKNVTSL